MTSGRAAAVGPEPFGQASGLKVRIVHQDDSVISPRDTLLHMKFAIAIPQFHADGEFDPAAFRDYLARAEELGFESAWTQEGVLGAGPQIQPGRGDDLRGGLHRAAAPGVRGVRVDPA